VATTTSTLPEQTCDGPTTLDINDCLISIFDGVERQREETFQQMLDQVVQPPSPYSTDTIPDVRTEWQKAEEAFVAYRKQTCDTEYLQVIDGTIRVAQALGCELRLTREHIEFLRSRLGH